MPNVSTPVPNPLAVEPSIRGFCYRNGVSPAFAYKEIAAARLIVRKAGTRTIVLPEDEFAWRRNLPIFKPQSAHGRPRKVFPGEGVGAAELVPA